MLIKDLRSAVEARPARSAWGRGVNQYALNLLEELADDYDFCGSPADKKTLLNGAEDWSQYSWGGSALIYDCDIAERLCSPSELKICRGGDRRPNAGEEWLDVQARALFQAGRCIMQAAKAGCM